MSHRLALLLLSFVVVFLSLVPDPTNAGFRLKKLAKVALLGAAIAPRFVPIPIPHHIVHYNEGYEEEHHHGEGYDVGHDEYDHA